MFLSHNFCETKFYISFLQCNWATDKYCETYGDVLVFCTVLISYGRVVVPLGNMLVLQAQSKTVNVGALVLYQK